jgi:hypothetical protein
MQEQEAKADCVEGRNQNRLLVPYISIPIPIPIPTPIIFRGMEREEQEG